MEFPILFDNQSMIESRKAIKDFPDYFTFDTECGNYQVDMQTAFLMSKSIRDLLYADKTCVKYFIPRNIYKKEFLEIFFNSLSTNIIKIPKDFFIDFVTISEKLQIECFQRNIEKTILSFLCDSLDENIADEQKFTFLCQNINNIDMEKLKCMPDWFISKLISNAIFNKENDRALFLIQKEEYLGAKYFEQLRFDALSKDVMSRIVTILEKNENSEIKQNLMPELIDRLKIELSHTDIYILNISTYNKDHPTLDLNFLYDLNKDSENKKYSIFYKTMYDTDLASKLEMNEKYLKSFDVVVLGGIDAFGSCCADCFKTSIFHAIEKYREEGGIEITLHDIAFGKCYDTFMKIYQKLIGYNDVRAYKINGLQCYKEAEFYESSGKNEIMSFPFKIKNPFTVAETHFTLKLDLAYAVIVNKQKDQHYYAENLDQNFADCAICHTTSITNEDEKKFFYNAICHLYESCHGHIPKSI